MNDKPPRADPTDRVMKIPPVDSPRHEEALLDQAVAESFPASDPISPAVAARLEPADVSLDKDLANDAARRKWFSNTMVALACDSIALI